ncbi:MAG: CvpA family protein, partial [Nevskiales bacterium]
MLWVDYLILGIVLVSAVIGLFRGFFREIISLVAWIAAFMVAIYFT